MTDTLHTDDMRPHTDTWVCGRCRKPFGKGERVTIAYITDGKALNPRNLGMPGLDIMEEFEMVHVDCRDIYLRKGILDG